jgi:hypothetical protein
MNCMKIIVEQATFSKMRRHLHQAERVTFGYAAYADGVFTVLDINPIHAAKVDSQSAVHVALVDEIRPRLIREALRRDLCLVEAHSHGPKGIARFSGSDLHGFTEWVPHVRWRLSGRPYAALVCAGETWDALAWRESATDPEPVAAIQLTGPTGNVAQTIPTTQATSAQLRNSPAPMRSRP